MSNNKFNSLLNWAKYINIKNKHLIDLKEFILKAVVLKRFFLVKLKIILQ